MTKRWYLVWSRESLFQQMMSAKMDRHRGQECKWIISHTIPEKHIQSVGLKIMWLCAIKPIQCIQENIAGLSRRVLKSEFPFFSFSFFSFWGHTPWGSEARPGSAFSKHSWQCSGGTTWDSGNRSRVGQVQIKCPIHCDITPAPELRVLCSDSTSEAVSINKKFL